jgi:mono/diheme cytochrome c family protein
MNPGQACIACHTAEREGPRFAIAGTVYPTGHEPDGCNGSSGGIQVVITDANGTAYTLTPNSAGNFYLQSAPGLALPYTAVVVQGGATRAMTEPQTSGDCNTCHTEAGAEGAPGRIVGP